MNARSHKFLCIISFVTGMGLISWILVQDAWLAAQKWFWYDEAYEILITCAVPYPVVITECPGQCSPAPLYYVFQKFVIDHIPVSGENLLISLRSISLVSCFLCLTLLLWTVVKHLNPLLGILIVLLMSKQPILHQYAAENRPYLMWVLLFTLNLVLFSIFATRPWQQVTRFQKTGIAIAILSLVTVSATGVIQAAGFCLFYFIFDQAFQIRNFTRQPYFKFFAAVFSMAAVLGVIFILGTCTHIEGGSSNLFTTKGWKVIRMSLSLLWPLHMTFLTLFFNFSFLVGLVVPFLHFHKRNTEGRRIKFTIALCIAASMQLLLALISAVLIIHSNYYFVPRLFIFVIVIRACLVIGGIYFTAHWFYQRFLAKRLSAFAKVSLELSLMSIVLLVSAVSVSNTQRYLNKLIPKESAEWSGGQEFACPQWKGQIAVVRIDSDPLDFQLNAIVKLAKDLELCNWRSQSGQILYYLPNPSATRSLDGYKTQRSLSNLKNFKQTIIGRPMMDSFDHD